MEVTRSAVSIRGANGCAETSAPRGKSGAAGSGEGARGVDAGLEAFREALFRKIAAIPVDPSQEKSHRVVEIPDAALARMRDDPEFYDQVMRDVARQREASFAPYPPAYTVAIWDDGGSCSFNAVGGERAETDAGEPDREYWMNRPTATQTGGESRVEKRKRRRKEGERLELEAYERRRADRTELERRRLAEYLAGRQGAEAPANRDLIAGPSERSRVLGESGFPVAKK